MRGRPHEVVGDTLSRSSWRDEVDAQLINRIDHYYMYIYGAFSRWEYKASMRCHPQETGQWDKKQN